MKQKIPHAVAEFLHATTHERITSHDSDLRPRTRASDRQDAESQAASAEQRLYMKQPCRQQDAQCLG